MANTKGAKTNRNNTTKKTPAKTSAPKEETADPDKGKNSPEISKDEGVENPDKAENTEGEAEQPEKEYVELKEEDILPTNGDTKEDNQDGTEPVLEAAGTGKFVDEALEQEREKEKDAFKKLIEENVKVERDLNKVKEELNVVMSERDDLELQVECHKQDRSDLSDQLTNKSREVLELEEKLRLAEAEVAAARGLEAQMDNPALVYDQIALEKRLNETQLRLKRMLKDDETREKRLKDLNTHNEDLEALVETLKQHITDKSKLENILEEHRKMIEERDNTNTNEELNEDNNSDDDVVARQEPKSQHNQSKVCSIQ